MLVTETIYRRLMMAARVLVLSCALFGQALAQSDSNTDTSDSPPAAAEEGVFSAPVVVDGEILFQVRGSSALPAEERAELIRQRIIKIAEQPGPTTFTLEIRDTELGQEIYYNDTIVTLTTTADAELEQMEMEVLSAIHAEAIAEAITAYRVRRS